MYVCMHTLDWIPRLMLDALCRDMNMGGSDLWSNTLLLDHAGALMHS